MQLKEEKADFLITLIGTSVMPNLIGIVTRIKLKGKVFLIHTDQTKKISDSLEEFIKNKNAFENGLNIKSESDLFNLENYYDPEKTYNELLQKFKIIYKEIESSGIREPIIELNYTGGTKVISSLSCIIFNKIFQKKYKNIHLTYLDGEKGQIHIFNSSSNKELIINYKKKYGTIPLTVNDVVDVHMGISSSSNETFKQSEFSKDFFKYIINNIDKKEDIIKYKNDLYEGLKDIKSSVNKVSNFLDEFSLKNKLLHGYNSANNFFESFYIKKDDLNKKKMKKISENLCGKWFEEVIHQILLELKEESIIDDFVSNLENKKDKKTTFELDFIAMKDYKLYYLSVSTVDKEKETEFKLYEAKKRVNIISDAESAVAAVTFVEDKDKIINQYMDIWQEKPRSVLITTWSELPKLKEIIKNWIINKGDVD